MVIVTAEIPEKWLQMRCGLLAKCVVKGYQEGEDFKVLKK